MKSTTVYIHVVTRGYETDIGEAFFSREDAVREAKKHPSRLDRRKTRRSGKQTDSCP